MAKGTAAASLRSPPGLRLRIAPGSCRSRAAPRGPRRGARSCAAEPTAHNATQAAPAIWARPGSAAAVATSPMTRSMSSCVTLPGRRIAATGPVKSSTVDSMPTRARPPSTTRSTLSPREAATCAASVGLTVPEMLALGAASGRWAAARISCAIGCAGMRKARLGRPAETSSDTGHAARRGRTNVSGPGQKICARRSKRSSVRAKSATQSRPPTCTISGLNDGRPLASKMRATARPCVASAARP